MAVDAAARRGPAEPDPVNDLTGSSVAEIADRVLPALTEAMNLLRRSLPAEEALPQGAGGGAGVEERRPELRAAAQVFVDAGFGGMQLRVHDEQGQWAGSAGVRASGEAAEPPVDGHAEALEQRIVRPLGLTGTLAPAADSPDLPEPRTRPVGTGVGPRPRHHRGPPQRRRAGRLRLPDGQHTRRPLLTAGLTTGDSDTDPAEAFPKALGELLATVFCGNGRQA
ncbi:hypothetical protein [Streptomyces cavernicola]|uniref:Uncharacterized protein n=1 Tax=Streptomyces cavernicola TaxID=3043613 RepID=A0ABT6SE56_9ACTN|nr:hypothetical protein [Streptomyces sp. B-S-A6]MDI3406475.1 hypothetical protein [Streptomyces sp. B-S-A6]